MGQTTACPIVKRSTEIEQLNWNYFHSLSLVLCFFVVFFFFFSFTLFQNPIRTVRTEKTTDKRRESSRWSFRIDEPNRRRVCLQLNPLCYSRWLHSASNFSHPINKFECIVCVRTLGAVDGE